MWLPDGVKALGVQDTVASVLSTLRAAKTAVDAMNVVASGEALVSRVLPASATLTQGRALAALNAATGAIGPILPKIIEWREKVWALVRPARDRARGVGGVGVVRVGKGCGQWVGE